MNTQVPPHPTSLTTRKLRGTVRQLVRRQVISDKNRTLSALARSLQNLTLNPI